MAKTEKEKEKEKAPTPQEQAEAYIIQKENKKHILNSEDDIHYKVSTGSLMLDIETNGGLTPGVHRLVGQNNQGKTPEAIMMLDNFLDQFSEGLGIYIKAEGRLSEENMKRSKRTFTLNPGEWSNNRILILETNVYEVIVNFLRLIVNNNPQKAKYGIIFDSTDALILECDLNKGAEDSIKVSGAAVISKKFLSAMNLKMTKFGHLVLMIGHATAEVKIDPYAKTLNRGGMYSGGSALQHFPNFIFEFQPRQNADIILDSPDGKLNDGKSKAIGHWCRIILRKSSGENKDKLILYPIKYGRKNGKSIWIEYEIAEQLLVWSLAKRKGPWIEIGDTVFEEIKEINKDFPKTVQGIDKLRLLLEENSNVSDFLYQKFKTTLANEAS